MFDLVSDIISKYGGSRLVVSTAKKLIGVEDSEFYSYDDLYILLFPEAGHTSNKRIDGLDKLLDFYSILEIGMDLRLFNILLIKQKHDILQILSMGAVQAYITKTYKSIIPFQLLERIQENNLNDRFYSRHINSPYLFFLSIYDYVRENKNLLAFLKESVRFKNKFFRELISLPGPGFAPPKTLTHNSIFSGLESYFIFLELFEQLLIEIQDNESFKTSILQFFQFFLNGDELLDDSPLVQSKELMTFLNQTLEDRMEKYPTNFVTDEFFKIEIVERRIAYIMKQLEQSLQLPVLTV